MRHVGLCAHSGKQRTDDVAAALVEAARQADVDLEQLGRVGRSLEQRAGLREAYLVVDAVDESDEHAAFGAEARRASAPTHPPRGRHAPPGAPAGRAGLKATIAWIHSGLDDITYVVQDAFASGDKVTVRCTMSGTHARPWLGSPATDRSFTVDQIHVYRVEGDRIAEHWACRDDLGMVRQLGIAPTP